jgi:hypothetical protein
MTEYVTDHRNGGQMYKWLIHCLADDNMDAAQHTLMELIDIGYAGDHAAELTPYKRKLVNRILTHLKTSNFFLALAMIWQLGEMGVNWPELTLVRDSVKSIRGF